MAMSKENVEEKPPIEAFKSIRKELDQESSEIAMGLKNKAEFLEKWAKKAAETYVFIVKRAFSAYEKKGIDESERVVAEELVSFIKTFSIEFLCGWQTCIFANILKNTLLGKYGKLITDEDFKKTVIIFFSSLRPLIAEIKASISKDVV